jgi:hypothetical protein
VGIHHATPLYPQTLEITSTTSGGRSVGKVRSRTKATELFLLLKSNPERDLDYIESFTDFNLKRSELDFDRQFICNSACGCYFFNDRGMHYSFLLVCMQSAPQFNHSEYRTNSFSRVDCFPIHFL